MIWDLKRTRPPSGFSVHTRGCLSKMPRARRCPGFALHHAGPFGMINELLCLSWKSRWERANPRDLLTRIWMALICMFYRCWEGVSIKILSNPAHTQILKHTSKLECLIFTVCTAALLFRTPMRGFGGPVQPLCAPLRCYCCPVRVNTHTHTLLTGHSGLAVVVLLFVCFTSNVGTPPAGCGSKTASVLTGSTSPLNTGQLHTPSLLTYTHTLIRNYTQLPHTLTAIKQHNRKNETLSVVTQL